MADPTPSPRDHDLVTAAAHLREYAEGDFAADSGGYQELHALSERLDLAATVSALTPSRPDPLGRLAHVIIHEVPGEPSRSEPVEECAVRLLRDYAIPAMAAALEAEAQPPAGLPIDMDATALVALVLEYADGYPEGVMGFTTRARMLELAADLQHGRRAVTLLAMEVPPTLAPGEEVLTRDEVVAQGGVCSPWPTHEDVWGPPTTDDPPRALADLPDDERKLATDSNTLGTALEDYPEALTGVTPDPVLEVPPSPGTDEVDDPATWPSTHTVHHLVDEYGARGVLDALLSHPDLHQVGALAWLIQEVGQRVTTALAPVVDIIAPHLGTLPTLPNPDELVAFMEHPQRLLLGGVLERILAEGQGDAWLRHHDADQPTHADLVVDPGLAVLVSKAEADAIQAALPAQPQPEEGPAIPPEASPTYDPSDYGVAMPRRPITDNPQA